MSPPVFVVDTNVVVAGLITGANHSPVTSILDAMLSGALVFLLSGRRPSLGPVERLLGKHSDHW